MVLELDEPRMNAIARHLSGIGKEKLAELVNRLNTPAPSWNKWKQDMLLDKLSFIEAVVKVLLEWASRAPQQASVGNLVGILEEMNLNKCAIATRKEFKIPLPPADETKYKVDGGRNLPVDAEALVREPRFAAGTTSTNITITGDKPIFQLTSGSGNQVWATVNPPQELPVAPGLKPPSSQKQEKDDGCAGSKGEDQIDYRKAKPLTVKITPPDPVSKSKFRDDDGYRLSRGFKGHALIINITNFGNNHVRVGAEHDTKNMKQLWDGLGYLVEKHTGTVTKSDFGKIVDAFVTKMVEDEEASSCVVFVGSHGEIRSGDNLIKTSDKQVVEVYRDLVDKFQVEELGGMPKMFFLQSCRLVKTDVIRNDTIVCFATGEGEEALRNEEFGSWFVYCLTQVFMENAHSLSLHKLLDKAKAEMVKATNVPLLPATATRQICDYLDFGMKTLYFNLKTGKE